MNSKSLGSKKDHPLVRKEEAPDIEVFLYLSCLLFSPHLFQWQIAAAAARGTAARRSQGARSLCLFHVPCSV